MNISEIRPTVSSTTISFSDLVAHSYRPFLHESKSQGEISLTDRIHFKKQLAPSDSEKEKLEIWHKIFSYLHPLSLEERFRYRLISKKFVKIVDPDGIVDFANCAFYFIQKGFYPNFKAKSASLKKALTTANVSIFAKKRKSLFFLEKPPVQISFHAYLIVSHSAKRYVKKLEKENYLSKSIYSMCPDLKPVDCKRWLDYIIASASLREEKLNFPIWFYRPLFSILRFGDWDLNIYKNLPPFSKIRKKLEICVDSYFGLNEPINWKNIPLGYAEIKQGNRILGTFIEFPFDRLPEDTLIFAAKFGSYTNIAFHVADNEKILLAAAQNSSHKGIGVSETIIRQFSERLTDNSDLMKKAISLNPTLYQYASEEIRSNRKFAFQILDHLNKRLKTSRNRKRTCLEIKEQIEALFANFLGEVGDNQDLVSHAVNFYSNFDENIPEDLRNSLEIIAARNSIPLSLNKTQQTVEFEEIVGEVDFYNLDDI